MTIPVMRWLEFALAVNCTGDCTVTPFVGAVTLMLAKLAHVATNSSSESESLVLISSTPDTHRTVQEPLLTSANAPTWQCKNDSLLLSMNRHIADFE
jgi:hypothetical protein